MPDGTNSNGGIPTIVATNASPPAVTGTVATGALTSDATAPTAPGGDAPYGYKRDGTPRKSNAGRRSDGSSPVDARKVATEAVKRAQTRAAQSRVDPNPAAPQAPLGSITGPVPIALDYAQFGRECAGLFFIGGTLAFGEAWKPDNEEEAKGVSEAFENWARYHGIAKMSPDFVLIATIGMYGASRFHKSETVKSRVGKIWNWAKLNLRIRVRKDQSSATNS